MIVPAWLADRRRACSRSKSVDTFAAQQLTRKMVSGGRLQETGIACTMKKTTTLTRAVVPQEHVRWSTFLLY